MLVENNFVQKPQYGGIQQQEDEFGEALHDLVDISLENLRYS